MKQFLPFTVIGLLSVAALNSARAAILTAVPMGGPMVHANILYNTDLNRIEVFVEPVVPRMTPLDVSNPVDNFYPLDPWFSILDPSQHGQAFNRQYGFVMDAGTDALPGGVGIWVRKLSSSPGLGLYRYRATDPKAWEPILGTAGTTNVMQWNLSMFHPSAAAPPPCTNSTHSADFEAFAVDLATGQPVAGIAPGSFTLNWTIVPSSRPTLRLTSGLVLCWPSTATNYILECTTVLSSATWVTMTETNQMTVVNGECTLPVNPAGSQQFYRLKRTP
jgi:hypothetical protein